MARRSGSKKSVEALPAVVADKVRSPVCVIAGSTADTLRLCQSLSVDRIICYQMDLYQADQLTSALAQAGLSAVVETRPDLWDLDPEFQTVLYPVSRSAERIMKIDLVEQAYHVLQPGGTLVVWSDYETDQLFPGLLKKVFGKIHSPQSENGTLLWCQRKGDHPRRRHEITVQSRVLGGESLRFLSRPGVFAYGRFDDGARAMVESAWIQEGDRVLDVGCGAGTNGAFAWQRCGPTGHITFMDSNLRAIALAEINARANGVTSFDTVASFRVDGVPEHSYDVVLANPPYFASGSIGELFIRRGAALLKPDGRFYLVTRQPGAVTEVMEDVFDDIEVDTRRGYTILGAWATSEAGGPLFNPNESADPDS